MYLQIECADKNGDVFMDLVDRSKSRKPEKIATMERGFNMKQNAQRIIQCCNSHDAIINSIKTFLQRWEKSGPQGSAQWEKFDAAILGLREAIEYSKSEIEAG